MNVFLKKFINNIFEKPAKALDLGAGDFRDINYLKRKGWDCEGVDINMGIDLELLHISKKKPFDLVFSNYVLHKIKNKNQFIKNAYKNLKRGGWFFVHALDQSDESQSSNITETYIRNMLLKNNFKNISINLFDYFDKDAAHKHWHRILEVTAQK